ncbi:MAG: HAMP domain-containing sensor histidine kinase [Bacteroidota bacterium]
MNLSHLPQEGFPFGNNIHFAYSINAADFLYVHVSLQWIVADGGVSAAIAKIEPEDVRYLQDVFESVTAGRFNGKITFKLRTDEGIRWLQVTPFLVDYQGEKTIIGTAIDQTDEVTNMHSVIKFTDKKNSILHMLGHDLRGPLNIAKSLTRTISRDTQDPVLLEKSGHITSILQQAIDLISDLVKREFLETTNTELVKKRIDIVKYVQEYLEECKRSEPLSKITFHLRTSAEKIMIRMDDAKFMQVINNLISNSLKFTPAGGLITISIEEQPDQVSFKFSDTGIGIPEALLPEIFEKFTAARRPGLQGEPTLGLGLSIVKTIIGWHDGRISCESKEGIGTTFFINLPKNLPV